MRHALRQLEAEGFVHIEPRRGASVATIGLADAQEMFEVRGALEALSARLAADRATHHDIADLEQIVVRGEAGARQHRLAELPNLNTEFHMRVAEVAGNRQLARLISDLRDRIQWIYSRHVERRAIHSWDEHRRLFDAIVAHDPDSAASIASDHIAAAKEAFTEGEAGR